MLQHLRKRLGIAEDRFAIHMDTVGNTLSSTIPLALEAAINDGRVHAGSRVVLTGFGVGYSWGSVLVEYPG
jgi:3-oxoacyl-[acyl-carrier-protein] synthase-3